ncbi:ATP-binding protein [Micromonosporaceae bacterium Da 78-11]
MSRVVLAEDNLDHQRVIAEVVRRLGHQVTVTSAGRAGLAAIVEQRPDLVIADVDMPNLDGVQMCRLMRANPDIAATPVVLVTAYLLPSDPRLDGAQATAVVRKPFSIAELTEALRPLLERQPAMRPSFTAHGRSSAADDPAFVNALLQSLDTGVAACDTEGRLVIFNQMLRHLFGDVGEAVPVDQWAERFTLRHHDGSPLLPHELTLTRALAGEHVHHADMMATDTQGRPRWFAVNAQPIRNTAGVTLGAVAAVHDITAEYRAQQYLDCETEVLKVLARSPDTATAGGQILRALGISLGWPYLRLWLVDEVTDVLCPAATFLVPGEDPLPVPSSIGLGQGLAGLCWQRGEMVWVPDIHAPDSPVLPQVRASMSYRAAGSVPVSSGDKVIGVITFYSHGHQAPEPALAVLLAGIAGNIGAYLEQRRAEELTVHLAAATDEYIALVGHELRTPLTSIGSHIDLIAESPDDTAIGEVRDMLEVVKRNSARMRAVVEQLLDLAALDSGHAELKRAPVDLGVILAEAAEAIRPTARQRHVVVDVTSPGRHLSVLGDPGRLRQVVHNLLENAVKFSFDDSVVTVSLVADDGDAAVLRVSDTGIGVPGEAHPHLFRADNARHTGLPGAGLGLALCRVVVERHRGTITVTPHRPSGTTVTVRLPRHDV